MPRKTVTASRPPTRSRQRRDDEKEQRREALIDAAEAVFALEGFDAAKVEDVARQARVSRALVYLYFANKEELLQAICLRALRRVRERFIAAIDGQTSGLAQIEAIGRAYVRFASECPLHFAAMSRFESRSPDPRKASAGERLLIDTGNAIHEVTIGALRRGMRDGSIRRLPQPTLTAMTLWGFIHGTIQIAQTKTVVLADAGFDVEDFLRHSIELCLRGLTPAARTRP